MIRHIQITLPGMSVPNAESACQLYQHRLLHRTKKGNYGLVVPEFLHVCAPCWENKKRKREKIQCSISDSKRRAGKEQTSSQNKKSRPSV